MLNVAKQSCDINRVFSPLFRTMKCEYCIVNIKCLFNKYLMLMVHRQHKSFFAKVSKSKNHSLTIKTRHKTKCWNIHSKLNQAKVCELKPPVRTETLICLWLSIAFDGMAHAMSRNFKLSLSSHWIHWIISFIMHQIMHTTLATAYRIRQRVYTNT